MSNLKHPFIAEAGEVLMAKLAPAVLLHGNVLDLFRQEKPDGAVEYTSLLSLIARHWAVDGIIPIVYETSKPLFTPKASNAHLLQQIWDQLNGDDTTDQELRAYASNRDPRKVSSTTVIDEFTHASSPGKKLDLLRQLCVAARHDRRTKKILGGKRLLILIERIDMYIPDGEIKTLGEIDRHRLLTCVNWLGDDDFSMGDDLVLMTGTSSSGVNAEITTLPTVEKVEVAPPNADQRRAYLKHQTTESQLAILSQNLSEDTIVEFTAGLSLHAMRRLITRAVHTSKPLTQDAITKEVERHLESILGEGVVEFKRPRHSMEDVIGFTRLKQFINTSFIPRLLTDGKAALPGAIVCGPIGGGKTFIFEAVAGQTKMPVIVLKGLRSKWYGGTDKLIESLRMVIKSLGKLLIFVDEADTQFGKLDGDGHETEKRLTGKIQELMSDPSLRGRVCWLLMTARVHLLSEDIRRSGRGGSLIIPVLDQKDEDFMAFVRWSLSDVVNPSEQLIAEVAKITAGYSSGDFAEIRSLVAAAGLTQEITEEVALRAIHDFIRSPIELAREKQTLEALLHCTSRALLPPNTTDETRKEWQKRLDMLKLIT